MQNRGPYSVFRQGELSARRARNGRRARGGASHVLLLSRATYPTRSPRFHVVFFSARWKVFKNDAYFSGEGIINFLIHVARG